MQIGTGETTYEWVDGWAQVPDTPAARDGWSHHGAVFTDDSEVIAFHQGEPKMLVFDRDGRLLRSWKTDLKDAHGMALAADDSGQYLWTADPGAKRQADLGYEYPDGPRTGQFVKWSLGGEKVMELVRPDISAYESGVYSPTSVTVFEERSGGNGDIWASDGYGESLIHRYNRDGEYLSTIDGTEGAAGHFDCPHCVWVDYRHGDRLSRVMHRLTGYGALSMSVHHGDNARARISARSRSIITLASRLSSLRSTNPGTLNAGCAVSS